MLRNQQEDKLFSLLKLVKKDKKKSKRTKNKQKSSLGRSLSKHSVRELFNNTDFENEMDLTPLDDLALKEKSIKRSKALIGGKVEKRISTVRPV